MDDYTKKAPSTALPTTGEGFGGRPVVTFESRRAAEMASLIERHGGAAIRAPSMREVTIDENAGALAFARALAVDEWDLVILLTGVGTRALIEEIAPVLDRAAFVAALGRTRVIVRGPKPAAVLRELGLRDFTTVPEPNTWREVRDAVLAIAPALAKSAAGDPARPLAGARIAVQEHGAPSTDLYAALADAGASVTPVAVYKWALPEDTAPLRAGLRTIAEGRAAIALFTSRAQVEHALAIAAEEGIEAAFRDALRRGVIASIGPVCSEALRAEGLPPDVEPEHPKMGHLVKTAASRAAAILEAKQAKG